MMGCGYTRRTGERSGAVRSISLMGSVASVLALFACGASDTTCGPGTVVVGDKCELDPNSESTPEPGAGPADDDAVGEPDPGAEPSEAAPAPTLLTESTGSCRKGRPGPAMVEVDGPSGKMCIDSTEVTQAQYQAFLDASPTIEFELEQCDGRVDFEPKTDGFWCRLEDPLDPVNRANQPVACIDYCNAWAFCKWAGKRLCGGADGVGVLLDPEDWQLEDYIGDPLNSEWAFVCSDGGRTPLPNGSEAGRHHCADERVNDVGTSNCEGPAGVHDLAGNVAEWAEICRDLGDNVECAMLGGGAVDVTYRGEESVGCYGVTAGFWSELTAVGFRCCGDTGP
jgi:formylglycine-generating enzyme